MKALNFNSIEKKYLTVTLNDEKNTTILVQSPTKKVMDYLVSMDNNGDVSKDIEQIEMLYLVCSEIMSRNKCNIKITKDLLEEIFDVEDIMTFLTSYMQFIGEQVKGKN